MRRRSGLDRQLGLLLTAGTHDEYTDGQLLERFSTLPDERAEQAFEALVHRHGPMVLRVCRASLRDPHDADDVFQATFLVLAKQARSLWVRDSLGPWLHQVAMRTSACLRSAQARRRKHETQVALQIHSPDDSPRRDPDAEALEQIIHQELNKLPERFRVPVVLCDLEGQTHEQAARNLGLPVGTVKSRLSRARERLRTRLTHRGLAPSAVTALVAPRSLAGLAITDALARSTTLAAVRFLTTRTLLGGSAALLAKGVLSAMLVTRIRNAAAILFAATTISGAGLMGTLARTPDKEPPADSQASTVAKIDELDLSVIKVSRGSFKTGTGGNGTLDDLEPSEIMGEVQGGTTLRSMVSEGVILKKGDVIGKLDDSEPRELLPDRLIAATAANAAYQAAKRAAAQAVNALKEYQDEILPSELNAIETEIQLAEQTLKAARDRLARTKAAHEKIASLTGVSITTNPNPNDVVAELDMANRVAAVELEIARADAEVETWRSKRQLVKARASARKLSDLESGIEAAKAVEQAKKEIVEQESVKLAEIERQIASCTIKAPHDGILLYARNPKDPYAEPIIKIGDRVEKGQLICRVIDLKNPMVMNLTVNEENRNRLKIGQPAEIFVEDYGKENGLARVVEISREPVPGPRPEAVPPSYPVRIQFEKPPYFLRPGMKAMAHIWLHDFEGTLHLPTSAIVTLGGKHHVFVRTLKDGHVRREVGVGLVVNQTAEITSGLVENERVVETPTSLLTESEKKDNERNTPENFKGPKRG